MRQVKEYVVTLTDAPFFCYPCARNDHVQHKATAWEPDIKCECPCGMRQVKEYVAVPTLHVLEADEIGDPWCSTCRDREHPYGTRWADHS